MGSFVQPLVQMNNESENDTLMDNDTGTQPQSYVGKLKSSITEETLEYELKEHD